MRALEDLIFPKDVKYSQAHVWISKKAPYRLGISDYAQDRIRGLKFVELPEVGTAVAKGDELGSLEGRKRVSPVYSPVSGKIMAVNQTLSEEPGQIKNDPYGQGWLVEIAPDDPAQLNELLENSAYLDFLAQNDQPN